jgi:hypothetical protein
MTTVFMPLPPSLVPVLVYADCVQTRELWTVVNAHDEALTTSSVMVAPEPLVLV